MARFISKFLPFCSDGIVESEYQYPLGLSLKELAAMYWIVRQWEFEFDFFWEQDGNDITLTGTVQGFNCNYSTSDRVTEAIPSREQALACPRFFAIRNQDLVSTLNGLPSDGFMDGFEIFTDNGGRGAKQFKETAGGWSPSFFFNANAGGSLTRFYIDRFSPADFQGTAVGEIIIPNGYGTSTHGFTILVQTTSGNPVSVDGKLTIRVAGTGSGAWEWLSSQGQPLYSNITGVQLAQNIVK